MQKSQLRRRVLLTPLLRPLSRVCNWAPMHVQLLNSAHTFALRRRAQASKFHWNARRTLIASQAISQPAQISASSLGKRAPLPSERAPTDRPLCCSPVKHEPLHLPARSRLARPRNGPGPRALEIRLYARTASSTAIANEDSTRQNRSSVKVRCRSLLSIPLAPAGPSSNSRNCIRMVYAVSCSLCSQLSGTSSSSDREREIIFLCIHPLFLSNVVGFS